MKTIEIDREALLLNIMRGCSRERVKSTPLTEIVKNVVKIEGVIFSLDQDIKYTGVGDSDYKYVRPQLILGMTNIYSEIAIRDQKFNFIHRIKPKPKKYKKLEKQPEGGEEIRDFILELERVVVHEDKTTPIITKELAEFEKARLKKEITKANDPAYNCYKPHMERYMRILYTEIEKRELMGM